MLSNATEPPQVITTTTSVPSQFVDDDQIPYIGVCTNKTKILTDSKKIYGYYKRSFRVQDNVENITVGGDLWLKHDDICKLQFKFNGTGPFKYCVLAKSTKNSTDLGSVVADASDCGDFDWKSSNSKAFEFQRFFQKTSDAYSLFVFVKNEVSLASRVVGINYYKREFHLSLIHIFNLSLI